MGGGVEMAAGLDNASAIDDMDEIIGYAEGPDQEI